MEKIINDSLIPFISNGNLSMRTVKELISIREFIDRVSTNKYISPEIAESMQHRFGATPNIETWGDYFQSDLAMVAITCDDEEFERILGTVRFDIIASWDIFSSSTVDFKNMVKDRVNTLSLSTKGALEYTVEEQETAHLGILFEYYTNLGINGNFYENELVWYNGYFDDLATGTDGVTIQ